MVLSHCGPPPPPPPRTHTRTHKAMTRLGALLSSLWRSERAREATKDHVLYPDFPPVTVLPLLFVTCSTVFSACCAHERPNGRACTSVESGETIKKTARPPVSTGNRRNVKQPVTLSRPEVEQTAAASTGSPAQCANLTTELGTANHTANTAVDFLASWRMKTVCTCECCILSGYPLRQLPPSDDSDSWGH